MRSHTSRLTNPEYPMSLDQSPVTRGSAEEKYRSDPLDLSAEDQQPLDPV
jgi:hypothetical protein